MKFSINEQSRYQKVSRQEAISRDLQFYWPPKPCINKHHTYRRTKGNKCLGCANVKAEKKFKKKFRSDKIISKKLAIDRLLEDRAARKELEYL